MVTILYIYVHRLINDAYIVEIGDSGLACKTQPRLLVPLGDNLESAYKQGRVMKAISTDRSDKTIYGVIVYDFTTSPSSSISASTPSSSSSDTNTNDDVFSSKDNNKKDKVIHFGPLAVNPVCQGKGVGRKLIDFVEEKGRREGFRAVKIHVMNVRSDLIPMYEKMNYVRVGREEYPYPERLSRYCFFHLYEKNLS